VLQVHHGIASTRSEYLLHKAECPLLVEVPALVAAAPSPRSGPAAPAATAGGADGSGSSAADDVVDLSRDSDEDSPRVTCGHAPPVGVRARSLQLRALLAWAPLGSVLAGFKSALRRSVSVQCVWWCGVVLGLRR
jgi:hypothetical protein